MLIPLKTTLEEDPDDAVKSPLFKDIVYGCASEFPPLTPNSKRPPSAISSGHKGS